MLTGRHAHSTGILKNSGVLPPNEPTFAQRLRDAGYATCFTGKLHLAQNAAVGSEDCDRRLRQMGFDDPLPVVGKAWGLVGESDCIYRKFLKEHGVFDQVARDYLDRILAHSGHYAKPFAAAEEYFQDIFISRLTTDWLASYEGGQPFFLWCNWGGPHTPWDAPGRYAEMYDPAAIGPPLDDPMERAPNALRQRSKGTSANVSEADWRACKALYYGNVNVIDDGIAAILQTLEQRGMLENTLVIYFSDHGEMLFDHGMLQKTLMYEASAGIPLLVRWPARFRQGVVSDAPTGALDLVPLMLELAGADPLPVGHGVSPLPVLTGTAATHRSAVFSEMAETKMVRQDNWKFVYNPNWEIQQLFDLAADPNEVNNLAGLPEHAATEARLREALLEWLINTEARPNSGTIDNRAQGRQLRRTALASYERLTGKPFAATPGGSNE